MGVTQADWDEVGATGYPPNLTPMSFPPLDTLLLKTAPAACRRGLR
jgi:hypothetical protein